MPAANTQKSPLALITGASGGIGAAIARRLARLGYGLILCGRRADRLDELREELGPNCTTLVFDLENPAAIDRAITDAGSAISEVELLVNCAGHDIGGRTAFLAGEIADWERIIEANLVGSLRVIFRIGQGMVRRGRGDIVNIGSLASLRPASGMAAYSASKLALHGLSECLRAELAKSDVRVIEISPGLTQTGFAEARFRGDSARAAAFYGRFQHKLAPEDVAAAVEFAVTRPRHVIVAALTIVPSGQ